MTVLDFGCGMGFFTIAMADLVGDSGRVIAADLQQQMLDVLMKRARKAQLSARITPHLCAKDALQLDKPIDFALAFYSAHETPDQERLLREISTQLRTGGQLLLVEPVGHVTAKRFQQMLDWATAADYQVVEQPPVRWSHTALLAKL
jgi:ubiquinone/menaquinone biosynthesis C-methylase UbiE